MLFPFLYMNDVFLWHWPCIIDLFRTLANFIVSIKIINLWLLYSIYWLYCSRTWLVNLLERCGFVFYLFFVSLSPLKINIPRFWCVILFQQSSTIPMIYQSMITNSYHYTKSLEYSIIWHSVWQYLFSYRVWLHNFRK